MSEAGDGTTTKATQSPRRPVVGTLLALAIGGAGGAIGHSLGLPAAWLSGSAIAVAVAALAGLPVCLPPRLRAVAFLILGTAMGSAVTPDAFASIGEWPLAILVLAATVTLLTAVSVVILLRVAGLDRKTAVCAALPGALSQVMVTAIEIGASLPRVALVQSIRLLVMVAVLPALITALGGGAGTPGSGLPAEAEPVEAILMLILCSAAGLLAQRLKMPAGLILGAFIASGALHGFGVFDTRLPDLVLNPAFAVLGTAIGAAFAGIALRSLLPTLGAGVAALLVALVISLGVAFAFARLTGAPFGEMALAFAPGGIEAMITLAFVLGYDVPFVATLHLVRVFGLTLALPLILSFVARDPQPPSLPKG